MRRIKRIITFILCLMLSVSIIFTNSVAYAYDMGGSNAQQSSSIGIREDVASSQCMDDMSMAATDSFGVMLQSELEDVSEEQEENEGYNVFSVEMQDNVAIVELETMEDCTLVVGIYDEETEQMLASGSLDVYQGETEVYVEIDIDTMPDYYYIRAYLVAFDTLQPLCQEYESSMYTKEMQELLAMTTDDFDSDRILNFDEDKTNNFAVYSEDTIVVPVEEGANEVSSVDEENHTYVIENANDYIKNLVEGDIFAYEYNDGENKVLLVKVKSVTLDGTTATIIGDDTSMDEVFDYVKIDEETTTSEAEADSECEEGVEYYGMVEVESDEPQTYGVGAEGSKKFAFSYKFVDKKLVGGENDSINVKLSGDVKFSIEWKIKVYLSLSEQYLEFKIKYGLDGKIKLTGKVNLIKVPLSQITVSPVAGLYIKGTPAIVLSAEGEVSFSLEMKGILGFEISNNGFKNLTSLPTVKTEITIEGKVFLGFSFKPEICIISNKVASISYEFTKGIELTGKLVLYETPSGSKSKQHECSKCLEGEINNVTECELKASVLNLKKLTYGLSTKTSKMYSNYYYSFDQKEYGLGKCPYYTYKITVKVLDENGDGLAGVTVFDDYVTGDNGKVTFYLPNGSYKPDPCKAGYFYVAYANERVYVNGNAKSLIYRMIPVGSEEDGDNPSTTDGVVIDEATFPDANFRQYVLDNIDRGNGVLSDAEIEAVEVIDCAEMDISDLTGINYFYNLQELDCSNNELTLLDVSGCYNLENLDCYKNSISIINVSNCRNLNRLSCYNNNLSSLDVSECISLQTIYCYKNNLTNLDVTGCTSLKLLSCSYNNISSLNVTGCTSLEHLSCSYNNISSLNVTGYTSLKLLNCYNNNISSLNVTGCTVLNRLWCNNNNLSGLDVTGCTSLEDLRCSYNNITNIDLTGCTVLESFDCRENKLSSLDVTGCISMKYLYCAYNNLSSLDVTKCNLLIQLNCDNNNLSSLDLTRCTALKDLVCDNNNLSSLDVTACTALTSLYCDDDVEVIGYTETTTANTSSYTQNTTQSNLQGSTQTDIDSGVVTATEPQDDTPEVLTYQSDATESIKTIHEVTTADDNHVDYTDLYSNQIYNLYVVKEAEDGTPFGDVLNSDNLLYIKQYTSDENGELSIDYLPLEEYENATEILVCSKRIDISAGYEVSISNLIYTGEEQAPIVEVKHSGELLTEGMDYELEGDFYVTDIGDYTVSIKGIGIFGGSIDINYSVLAPVVNIESIVLDATKLSLEKGDNRVITFIALPEDATDKTVTWSSSDTSVATVDSTGKVTALKAGTATITATATDGSGVSASCTVSVTEPTTGEPTTEEPTTEEPKPEEPDTSEEKYYPVIDVSYRTHIQTFGWEGNANDIKTWKSNGIMSGTSGKAKRLEGINIVVNSAEAGKSVDLGIQYTTHCQSYGWLPWSADGDMNGTEGEAKRLEAIKIQLTGADKDAYDVYYRVHAQTYGWLGWAINGEPSGTAGYSKRLEGIQIVVVKKGEDFNKAMEGITSARAEAYIAKEGSSPIVNYPSTSNTNPVVPGADTPNVAYRTHVQSFGWQGWKYNGQMSGTSGLAKRLEGININLTNKPYDGDIVYTTHIQSYGWKDGNPEDTTRASWKKNGAMSGTSGEAKRLEAICIDLTGEMAEHYDIYYRVHAQSFGWLGWAKNGEESGTAGYAKRLEGIQIVLVPKGGAAPANNYGGVTSVRTEAYIEK